MRLPVILFVSVFLSLSSVTFAEKSKVTGTFSDMSFVQEGGDVVGHELRIVFTHAGYEGVYQVAEGSPSELMLVKIAFKGDQLRFSVPSGNYAGTFDGTIDIKGVKGIFTFKGGGEERLDLPRHKSYWE